MVLVHSGRASPAQLRRDRAKTRRELERSARARLRDRILELRKEIKALRKSKPERRRVVRELCKLGRELMRERWRHEREALRRQREALRERVKEERATAGGNCRAAVDAVASDLETEIADKKKTIEELRRGGRDDRMLAAAIAKLEQDRRTPAERRAAEEEEAAHSVTPELLPVWERVKHKIRPRRRETLIEAFYHWVHDHSAEVSEIVHADEIAHLREREREEAVLSKAYRQWKKRGGAPPKELREVLERTGEIAPSSSSSSDDDDGGEWGGF